MNIVQRNDEVFEKIAQLLENLPSDYLLEKVWTEEQREYWYELRDKNRLLAKLWRAELIVEEGYQIEESVDRKELDPLEYNLRRVWVKCYKILWDMIEQAEADIKAFHSALRSFVAIIDFLNIQLFPAFYELFHKYFRSVLEDKYPFGSAYELFTYILMQDANREFGECLKYYEISINKTKYRVKQVKNLIDVEMKNDFIPRLTLVKIKQEFQQLKKNYPLEELSISWVPIALIGCQLCALSKPSMKDKLIRFYGLINQLSDLCSTAYRKRGSKTWKKRRSYAWINGKKVYASTGGVYRPA